MKAVILAGGLGTRMREETEFRPKPMVQVGGKPVLWHIMKILSTQGITEFVICAGYKADVIRDFFMNLRSKSMDFTIDYAQDGLVTYHGSFEEADWKVTVADTGPYTNTGGRIAAVRHYLDGERFFVTYGDGIADVKISELLSSHKNSGAVVTLTTTKPLSRFGVVKTDLEGRVETFLEKPQGDDAVNIGYFIMEPRVFEFLTPDSVLEQEPLQKLAAQRMLNAYHHAGFWQPMDTQREAQLLNEAWTTDAPWKIW